MCSLFGPFVVETPAEAVKASLDHALVVADPVPRIVERAWTDTAVSRTADLFGRDEFDLLKDAQVLLESGESYVERLREVAYRRAPQVGELLEDRPTRGISERRKRPVEARLMLNHKVQYMLAHTVAQAREPAGSATPGRA